MSTYQIVLAEDHQVFRSLVRRKLESTDEFEVVGEVNDGRELLDLLGQVSPDLVILDISMPNLGGMEVARRIKLCYPQVKILFLTMHKNPVYAEQAKKLGVAGFLLKEDMDQSLVPAISRIRAGETCISPIQSPDGDGNGGKKNKNSKSIPH